MGNDIMKIIDGINQSLKIIVNKDGGVVIHDTLAKTTTVANFITTILATVFGGWVTIQLFKTQEKMRIKQDLRLNFFKEYKVIYNRLLQSLVAFENELNIVNSINIYPNKDYYKVKENTIHDKKILEYKHQEEFVSKVIDLCKIVYDTMKELNDYLVSNEIVLRDYKGELFKAESAFILILKTNINRLTLNYNSIEIINSPVYGENVEEVNELKQHNKEYFDSVIGLEIEKKVTNLINNVKNKHSEIENEFMDKYFKIRKIRWYKKCLFFFKK